MRILFIAYPHSAHSLRWISQITGRGWDIHLFPSQDFGWVNDGYRHITVHHSIYSPQVNLHPSVHERGLRIGVPFLRKPMPVLFRAVARSLTYVRSKWNADYRVTDLRRVIERIQPDLVHSLEFQHAGYLALAVRQQMGDRFPTWIATNYGSDLYLYARLPDHQARVRAILELADYYDCECERDVIIAQRLGLKAEVVRPVLPNGGGFHLDDFVLTSRTTPPSTRRQIIIKGYQHFAGRALVALEAVRRCADMLSDYTVAIYSATDDVQIAATLLAHDTGIDVRIMPEKVPHDEMLRAFGQSRVYIGLSISDAISTSMLEAMTMGALPIQSNTACTTEWVTHDESALIVPPEDPQSVADALRRAITDDVLVDQAAQINLQTARERLDATIVGAQAIDIYTRLASRSSIEK